MAFFAYKARTAGGEQVHGILEGNDSGAVADHLLSSGMTPVEIAVTTAAVSGADKGWRRLFEEKVKPMDVQLFSRQMYALLKAGVPIMRGLAGLQESAMSKAFARALQDVRASLESGHELNVSMSRQPQVFSPFYINMVRVGEATGMLEEIFLRLFDHMEFEREIRDRVKAALRYPMFVIATLIVAVAVINLFVIPAFAKVFAGLNVELPLMTRVLVASSDFTLRFWPLILLLAAAATVSFRMYIRTAGGKYWWDKIKLRLPIAGKIILKATLARFARSFALASKSGVPIVQGLSVVAQVTDNDFIAGRIVQMREGIERGESILTTANAAGMFTPVVLQMIAVGEETGELDDLMQEVAEMYDREVEYEVKTISAQIEPVLIISLGILVLILALGVFLPIWDLGRAALHK